MGIKKQEPDEKHVLFPLHLAFWANQRTLYTFLVRNYSFPFRFLCFLDIFPLLKRREGKGPGYLNLLRLLIYKDFYAPPLFPDIIHLDSVNPGIIPH
jgi:hypothetical protein